MQTKLSVCRRKAAYWAEQEAMLAAAAAGLDLRTYRCDRCRLIHLTSRTKGKRRPDPLSYGGAPVLGGRPLSRLLR